MFTKKQQLIYDSMCGISSSEKVVDIFLNYFGSQIFDDDFYDYLCFEGVMDEGENKDE